MSAELGSCRGTSAVLAKGDRPTIAMELEQRLSTYSFPAASWIATPVGPSPTSTAAGAARSGPKMHAPAVHDPSTRKTFRDPIAVRYPNVPVLFHTIIPGC